MDHISLLSLRKKIGQNNLSGLQVGPATCCLQCSDNICISHIVPFKDRSYIVCNDSELNIPCSLNEYNRNLKLPLSVEPG